MKITSIKPTIKHLYLFVFIICFCTASQVNAQNTEFKESILEEISKSQTYLKSLIELGALNDTPIKFSSVIPLDPEPIELSPKNVDYNRLESEIKSLKWTQKVTNEETIISLEDDLFEDYLKLNDIEIYKIIATNIKFHESKKTVKEIETDVSFNHLKFSINCKRKRIKSFDLKLVFKATKYSDFEIKENETSLDSLQIVDVKIKNKSITFLKIKSGKQFKIYATDKNELIYKSTGMSSMSQLLDKEIARYKTILLFLEDVKKQLINNKFKTEKEVEAYAKANAPKEVTLTENEKKLKQTFYNFDFSIEPEKIIIRVIDKEINSNIMASFLDESTETVFIARNSNYDYGLIDRHGNWIVKPEYQSLTKNKYFKGYYNGIDKTIWVSQDSEESEVYNFRIHKKNMLIKQRFQLSEYRSTKGHGLFNANTRKLILPAEKNIRINYYNSYYFLKKRQDNDKELESVYDKEGSMVFNFDEQYITLGANNLFCITKNEKAYLYKYDTINKKTKLITSRDYTHIYTPHNKTSDKELEKNPLFQAKKANEKTSDYLTRNGEIAIDGEKYAQIRETYDRFIVKNKNDTYSILDKHGKLIKKLDPNYIPKGGYSGYLLRVQNKETKLFGYIDKSCNLTIPFMYTTATRFIKDSDDNIIKADVSIEDNNENIVTEYTIDDSNNLVGKKEITKHELEDIQIEESIEIIED